jgi:hypothetical protein
VHSTSAILLPGFAGGNGLTFLVFGTVAFSIVMSVLFLVTHGGESPYEEIGHGGMSRESDYPGEDAPAGSSPSAIAEQELEIRQMLRARSERLVRAGKPALDIDAEVARLLSPGMGEKEHDPALVAEVRQMVLARNERRMRKGEEPLDVEAEVAGTLQELAP